MSRDPNLKVLYSEHSIEDVMKYFVGGSNCEAGPIMDSEWFVDPVKHKVILKLYIDVSGGHKIITAERN